MIERLDSYDWREAFAYAKPTRVIGATCSDAPFRREDVREILAAREGENDELPWIGIFRLTDGRFVYLEAGCDFTGWDCQADGFAQVGDTLEQLVRFGVGQQSRRRLGCPLPEDPPPNFRETWQESRLG